MQLRMWMLDIAREQSPTLDHLRRYLELTQESGYNAIGLYLEHRFAYPSTPWSHGVGCVTPKMILTLQDEYPDLQIVPFINLLGHFEGMMYTEYGKQFREETFKGLQACPCNTGFVDLCNQIIEDTVSIFRSELIHIGGDETQQLGACPKCKAKVEAAGEADGKAILYGDHFGPLARKVQELGRRPAVWGDMFLEHPTALGVIPRETLIFDWQYFKSPLETSRKFIEKGFEVVGSPAILTYNALWCHLKESEENVREHVEAINQLDAHGVCVTTWECGLMGNYETLFPVIRACGEMLANMPEQKELISQPDSSPPQPDKYGEAKKRFFFNPTPQIPDPSGGLDMSIAVGICDSIFMNAIDRNVLKISLELGEEESDLGQMEPAYLIRFDGEASGKLPAEQGEGVMRRFVLLSNMNPLRPVSGQQGKISCYRLHDSDSQRDTFEYEVQATGGTTPSRMDFISTTPKPTQALGSRFIDSFGKASDQHEEWARLMSDDLQALGGMFACGQIRSGLKCRLLLYSNPFLAWMHHHEELCGETGDKALAILAHAIVVAPTTSMRGVAEFGKLAIEFVRYAEASRKAYANRQPGAAAAELIPARAIFDQLEKIAIATSINIGGSKADIERCGVAKEHVERVIRRIKQYGDGSLGYLPAFEIITHPKFMPHDQASWWLINRWANE